MAKYPLIIAPMCNAPKVDSLYIHAWFRPGFQHNFPTGISHDAPATVNFARVIAIQDKELIIHCASNNPPTIDILKASGNSGRRNDQFPAVQSQGAGRFRKTQIKTYQGSR